MLHPESLRVSCPLKILSPPFTMRKDGFMTYSQPWTSPVMMFIPLYLYLVDPLAQVRGDLAIQGDVKSVCRAGLKRRLVHCKIILDIVPI